MSRWAHLLSDYFLQKTGIHVKYSISYIKFIHSIKHLFCDFCVAGIVVVAEATGWLGSGLYPYSRLVGETNIHKNIIIIQLGKYSDRDTHMDGS